MTVRFKKFAVLSLLILLILAAVPVSVNAGAKIGNAYVVSDDPEVEVFPSVAYNSTRQEYLVVWYNDRAGNDDIRAQRLTRDGLKIGSPFYISAGAGNDRRYPDVAYNSQHDQYLVVWEDEGTLGTSIHARRVSGTGMVLDTSDIVIRSGGGSTWTPVKPAVAYAYTSDCYMVVWAETWHPMPITYSIYALDVDENAVVGSSMTTVVSQGDNLGEPDIAYNRHANRHLVVWEEYNPGTTFYHIMGQQIHGGGGTYLSKIVIAYFTADCTNPAIASIPTSSSNYKFMVAYEADYITDKNIFVNFIEEGGTVGGIKTPVFTANDETHPAVAGNEETQEYFLVWREDAGVVDKPVKGYQFSSSGTDLGIYYEFSGPATDNPAVVAGHLADFLIVWQDQPVFGTNMNIYAQLFGNREFLPLFLNKP